MYYENIDLFLAHLKQQLGFERDFKNDVNAFETKKLSVFLLSEERISEQEKIQYDIAVRHDPVKGYELPFYNAFMWQYEKMEHIRNEKMDSRELEQNMKRIDWSEFMYDPLYHSIEVESGEEKAIIKNVEKIIDDLGKLEQSGPEGKQIAEQLQVKYWLGNPMEVTVSDLYGLKQKCETWHSFELKEDGPEITAQEAHNLLLGRPVFKMVPEDGSEAWLILDRSGKQGDEPAVMRQYASHYNYNVGAVLEQLLTIAVIDPHDFKKDEVLLLKGEEVRVPVHLRGQSTFLSVTADPLNCSIDIKDPDGETVAIKELKGDLTPPIVIDHYELFAGKEHLQAGHDYHAMLDALHSHLGASTQENERQNYIVAGVEKGYSPVFDQQGKLCEHTAMLVMSGDSFTYGKYRLNHHLYSGDIMTDYEKGIREALKDYPFLKNGDYRRIYDDLTANPSLNTADKINEALHYSGPVKEQGQKQPKKQEQGVNQEKPVKQLRHKLR